MVICSACGVQITGYQTQSRVEPFKDLLRSLPHFPAIAKKARNQKAANQKAVSPLTWKARKKEAMNKDP